MPLEIEIKLKVPSHTPLRTKLRALKAKSAGTVRETNIFFIPPVAALRRAHLHLRVRLTTTRGKITALVTFKQPPGKDALRSREAFDIYATPSEQVIPMLVALGFKQAFLFEKDRESWLLGGCRVELDTLPHLGRFVEIEGPSERAVRQVQRALGLADQRAEESSYAIMVGTYLVSKKASALRFRPAKVGKE